MSPQRYIYGMYTTDHRQLYVSALERSEHFQAQINNFLKIYFSAQLPPRALRCIPPLRRPTVISLTFSHLHKQTSTPTSLHKWSLLHSRSVMSPHHQLDFVFRMDSYLWRKFPENPGVRDHREMQLWWFKDSLNRLHTVHYSLLI